MSFTGRMVVRMACCKRCRGFVAFLLLFFLLSGIPAGVSAESDTYNSATPEILNEGDLVGKAAILIDADSGKILFEKNARRQTYPASTTKIMTCLVALENWVDLDKMVTVGNEISEIPADSSKAGIRQGEEYPMIDLLYGLILKSGNDAAMTIAVNVAGSVSEFVKMMNDEAARLGCNDTHFLNPHGYHEEGHVTTAYDLSVIARYAMQNKTFREIAGTKNYTMSSQKKREKWRITTTVSMFDSTSKYYYPDLIGIKTGHHNKSGYCFVGAADKSGTEMISVVLKSKDNYYWQDTIRLFNYGITCYETLTYTEMFNQAPVYASVANASSEDENSGLLKVSMVPGTQLDSYTVRCLPENLNDNLTTFASNLDIHYTNDLTAPIMAGEILGTVDIDVNDQIITATVIASRDVEEELAPFTMQSLLSGLQGGEGGKLLIWLIGLIALILVLFIIMRVHSVVNDRKERKEAELRKRAIQRREAMRQGQTTGRSRYAAGQSASAVSTVRAASTPARPGRNTNTAYTRMGNTTDRTRTQGNAQTPVRSTRTPPAGNGYGQNVPGRMGTSATARQPVRSPNTGAAGMNRNPVRQNGMPPASPGQRTNRTSMGQNTYPGRSAPGGQQRRRPDNF